MPQNSKIRFLPYVLAAFAITALIIMVLEATALLDGPAAWGQGVTVRSGDGWIEIEEFDFGEGFSAELEGRVEFNDEENAVVSLSRGGKLELEEKRKDRRYRLEVTPGSGGEPRYEWSVDGDRRDFDAEARRWLADAVPRFLRLSGINAEARVERILVRGGVSAVLDEIESIRSDSGQTRYLEHLFAKADLGPNDLARALEIAASEIGTDSAMAEFLERIEAESLADRVVLRRFVDAAETIGTDSTMGRTLSRFFADPALASEAREQLLEVSTSIGTDSELAKVLQVSAEARVAGKELPRSFFDAAETLGTDSEHRKVLEAVAASPDLSTDELRALLTSARGIGTDSDLARLLIELLRHQSLAPELEDEFQATLETVGTRSERERVLLAWK